MIPAGCLHRGGRSHHRRISFSPPSFCGRRELFICSAAVTCCVLVAAPVSPSHSYDMTVLRLAHRHDGYRKLSVLSGGVPGFYPAPPLPKMLLSGPVERRLSCSLPLRYRLARSTLKNASRRPRVLFLSRDREELFVVVFCFLSVACFKAFKHTRRSEGFEAKRARLLQMVARCGRGVISAVLGIICLLREFTSSIFHCYDDSLPIFSLTFRFDPPFFETTNKSSKERTLPGESPPIGYFPVTTKKVLLRQATDALVFLR